MHKLSLAEEVRRQYAGALYSPKRKGAACPKCGKVAPRTSTRDWIGANRIRYHKCGACSHCFKSIEPDFSVK